MIIICKNFSDPHKDALNFAKEGYERAEKERALYNSLHPGKPHEITKIGAVNPSRRDEMIKADKKHDFQEGMEKGLAELKDNNWNLTILNPKKTQESAKPVEKSETPTPQKSTLAHKPAPKVVADPKSPSKEESVENDKKGMSTGAKVGIATAGVAAAGAAGYAAYKAWKKRKAKRAGVDAEVDKFLKNNYKTSK